MCIVLPCLIGTWLSVDQSFDYFVEHHPLGRTACCVHCQGQGVVHSSESSSMMFGYVMISGCMSSLYGSNFPAVAQDAQKVLYPGAIMISPTLDSFLLR